MGSLPLILEDSFEKGHLLCMYIQEDDILGAVGLVCLQGQNFFSHGYKLFV